MEKAEWDQFKTIVWTWATYKLLDGATATEVPLSMGQAEALVEVT